MCGEDSLNSTSAKCERIYLNEYHSISELITDVGDYIEFYNYQRFHQTLEYKKPMDVYQENIKLNSRMNLFL
jgi:putative transposase